MLVQDKPDAMKCRSCPTMSEPFRLRTGGWIEFPVCNECRVAKDREVDEGQVDEDRQSVKVRDTLPMRLRGFSFESITWDNDNRRTLRKLQEWGIRDGSVFVCGPVGPGKSVSIACLARKLILEGVDVGWVSEQRLMRNIRNSYGGRGRMDIQEWASTVPVLFLDDLGAAARTDWERRVFEEILTDRYDDCRPVVASSNYTLEDLRPMYAGQFDERNEDPLRGEKIVDRLRQMVGPRQWTLEGPSRRRQ